MYIQTETKLSMHAARVPDFPRWKLVTREAKQPMATGSERRCRFDPDQPCQCHGTSANELTCDFASQTD
jgi:hypothetical protein